MDQTVDDRMSALEAKLAQELALLTYPRRPWVAPKSGPDGEPLLDVLIIGGGQSGLACAAALKREKIERVLVVDQNAEGKAGPWLNFARMNTLRTPKYLTGPDLGIPSLTLQAWYEARHGDGAWERLKLLPKEEWAAYLSWYRKVLGLQVRWKTIAGTVQWDETLRAFRVPVGPSQHDAAPPGAPKLDNASGELLARRVVLATGIEGSGDWSVPGVIQDNLPSHLYAHTRHAIDFEALRGKKIGILGAGASAFDNASVALETGAAEVHLFFRRERLVNINPYRWAEFVGFLSHVGDLDDAGRWRFIRKLLRMGQLPPADTYARAKAHDGFKVHPASPWERVSAEGDQVKVETAKGSWTFDFVISGTGFVTDLSKRAELSAVCDKIALWEDRYTPETGQEHADLARHPYLGPGFEFMEREPGQAPWLSYLYNYTFGCLLSLGFGGGSISGMKYSLPRLVGSITRSFFVEDQDAYFQSLCDFDEREF